MFLGWFSSGLIWSQDTLLIDDIQFIGNKKTKTSIIERELDFSIGDTLLSNDTARVFLETELKVFNTELFLETEIISEVVSNESGLNKLIIKVLVKERWYVFPLPIVELADRNINVWRTQHDADLSRIEWGMRFDHENFRGRNEKLQIVLQAGFTKKYEVFHFMPYLNKKKTLGIKYGVSYSTNKSVGYTQEQNELLFLNSDEVLRRRFYSTSSVRFRPSFYTRHEIGVNYHHNTISRELLRQTEYYLNKGFTKQQYFKIFYNYNLNKTNINYYPTSGYEVDLEIAQNGLGNWQGVNQTVLELDLSAYKEIKTKFNYASRLSFKASTFKEESYLLQEGLGYEEDFVRGYQAFVVDGQNYALWRNEFKYNFLNFTHNWGKLIPVKQFRKVPYSFYLKLFSDYGFTDNNIARLNASLQNRLMSGHGIGLDLVSYYDLVFRIELSVNQELNKGVFLHLGKAI